MSRNLVARILVAAVFIPVIVWIVYRGSWWLFGMLLLFALIAMSEFLYREGYSVRSPVFAAGLVMLAAVFSAVSGMPVPGVARIVVVLGSPLAAAGAMLAGFFLLSAMLFGIGKSTPAELYARHSRLFWGVTYLGLTYPIVFLVGKGVGGLHGGDALLFLFGLLWLGDTAAMFVGKALGRHKLAPSVSPNKTVEGFIGGIAGAAVIGVVMYFWKFPHVGFGHIMVIAAGASVCGQLGDLVESMWKRSLGIKDSSAIIPGHGGVLDRFDSLLFAAPFVYAYLALVLP